VDIVVAVAALIAGFVLLYYGGDHIVIGSIRLAAHLGVAPVVIGLTVVAFGTSLPELLVSFLSAYQGHCTVAVGNILGSDIFNLCLIVGVSAILANPLEGSPAVARRDYWVLVAGMVAFGWLGMDLLFSRIDGVILFSMFVAYMALTVLRPATEEPPQELIEALEDVDSSSADCALDEPSPDVDASPPVVAQRYLGHVLAGIVMLPLGAHFLVKGGVELARMASISERVIAMTLVSWGTSLPEMTTSLMAAYRGHAGLCIGNVVGSNIFNTVAIMGFTALCIPVTVLGKAMSVDYVLACVATILLGALHWYGRSIGRLGGALLLVCFAAMFVLLLY